MIKRLLNFLGYVPKEKLMAYQNQLEEGTIVMDRAKTIIKSLKKNIKILEKTISERNKELQSIISKSDYKIKQLNTKNLRLLRKQGKFKEKIKELNQHNADLFDDALEFKDQAYYYKVISEAALEKLEYLCFGSILPKALRPSHLDRYQHLYKPVTPTYFKDRYGHIAIGVEYGQSED